MMLLVYGSAAQPILLFETRNAQYEAVNTVIGENDGYSFHERFQVRLAVDEDEISLCGTDSNGRAAA